MDARVFWGKWWNHTGLTETGGRKLERDRDGERQK